MAADEQAVELLATTGGLGSLGELLAQNRTPARTVDLDVLSEDNAETYWTRDERFDVAVSLNRGQPALSALCRVLQRWIAHFLAVDVTIRRSARSSTRAGYGMSGSTPKRACCSTICTTAKTSPKIDVNGCCACSSFVSPTRRRCVRRSPGGRYTWRWRWIVKTACGSSRKTCC